MIERKAFTENIDLDDDSPFSAIQAAAAAISSYIPTLKRTWIIVAYNRLIGRSKEMGLSYWEMDPAGYPCKLRWRTGTFICEDKTALSRALADLLRDTLVGQKIYTLMRLDPPKKQEDLNVKKDDQ